MRNLILILISIVLFSQTTMAQKKIENFENNAFNWEDVAEKNKSATIQDGSLKLQVKKNNDPVIITTRFPLDIEYPFKITATFVVPELNNKKMFGFVYNWINEETYSRLELSENRYTVMKGGIIDSKGKIKLPKGKKQTITVTIENKVGKQIFKVNNVTVCETKQQLKSPYCGFFLISEDGKAQLMINEVVVEQVLDDE